MASATVSRQSPLREPDILSLTRMRLIECSQASARVHTRLGRTKPFHGHDVVLVGDMYQLV